MNSLDPDAVEWSRMAEPQEGGYDTKVALTLAASAPSRLRFGPYVRRLAGDAPTICEGQVAVRHLEQAEMSPPAFTPAPPDHPNLLKAVEYLRRWPAAYEQFKALIDTVHPCLDARIKPEHRELSVGSSSHSHEQWLGVLCVTVDHPFGCAQGLIRETARQKLRALGVWTERAWRFISNDPSALYPSPIYPGQSWPMTAALHAAYSLTCVAELDMRVLESETGLEARDQILQLLMRNAVRMEACCDSLARYVETDAVGDIFMKAFLDWAGRATVRAYALLDENGYEILPHTELM